MKPDLCQSYKKLIERYSCKELGSEDTKRLLEHAGQCPACRQHLETVDELDKKLKNWARALEPMIEKGQAQAIKQLRLLPAHSVSPVIPQTGKRAWVRYAAAACILMTAGFLAGRGWGSSADIDRKQLEQQITASVLQSLRPEVLSECAGMQDALSDQINVGLKSYAEQIVAHNDEQVYQLLTGLIEAIETSQIQNQQWALSAMAELEGQRLRDQEQVNNQVAALAMYTGNELLRTQQAIESLKARQDQ